MTDPLLEAILNLSHFHREHEKFYAQEPRLHDTIDFTPDRNHTLICNFAVGDTGFEPVASAV